MRRILVSCVLLVCASTSLALAETVTIPGTTISFSPPEGFTLLTQEDLDIKFPHKNGPRFAYGNERRTTTVAYDVKPSPITPEMLRGGLDPIGELMGRAIPGLVWVEKKIVRFSGLDWAYFEMTSSAIDTDIHNIIIVAAWQGKMVIFNFNSTKSGFEKIEPALRASMESIVIKDEPTKIAH